MCFFISDFQINSSVLLCSDNGSVLLVADIFFLGGIKHQVADGSYQRINADGKVGENEICPRSGGESFGLKGRVVNDNAADKAQEEGQQKANKVFVVHSRSPYYLVYLRYEQPPRHTPRMTPWVALASIIS